MFCSNCGVKATGNFCASCGTRLVALVDLTGRDWRTETDYQVLLQFPEVRERIAASAGAAKERLSGEQFLELAEKALEPLLHGLPMAKLGTLIQPIYARMGIATSKTRSVDFAQPIGEVMVGVLVSLAGNGHTIKQVQQAEDGCLIEAVIPSDWRSFAGELALSVHRTPEGTRLEAAARILGQFFDWGKSEQTLVRLFNELQSPRLAA